LKLFKIKDLTIPVLIILGGMGIGISLSGLASVVAKKGGFTPISTKGVGLIRESSDKTFRQIRIVNVVRDIYKASQNIKDVFAIKMMSIASAYDVFSRYINDYNINCNVNETT